MGAKITIPPGTVFGELTVIGTAECDPKNHASKSLCRCSCGEVKVIRNDCLRSGKTRSCGCKMKKRIPIPVGERFGMLVVIGEADSIGWQSRTRCRCDCGNEVVVYNANLRRGAVESCGCKCNRPNGIGISKLCNTAKYKRLHRIWSGMKSRCYNPHEEGYFGYGMRGTKMCEEWKNSFQSFLTWSLENGYSEKLSIDRINCEGDYEPSNCRWASQEVQIANRRKPANLREQLERVRGAIKRLAAEMKELRKEREKMINLMLEPVDAPRIAYEALYQVKFNGEPLLQVRGRNKKHAEEKLMVIFREQLKGKVVDYDLEAYLKRKKDTGGQDGEKEKDETRPYLPGMESS